MVGDAMSNPTTPSAVEARDRIASMSEKKRDEYWMKMALKEAEKALVVGEVPVGCVIVRNNALLSTGFNDTNRTRIATRHAEFIAVDKILSAGFSSEVFKECTLYVSVEPCLMCGGALRQLSIGRVVFGCGNERFGGCGSIQDLHSGIAFPNAPGDPFPVKSGVFPEAAVALLRRFYRRSNFRAPCPKRDPPAEDAVSPAISSRFIADSPPGVVTSSTPSDPSDGSAGSPKRLPNPHSLGGCCSSPALRSPCSSPLASEAAEESLAGDDSQSPKEHSVPKVPESKLFVTKLRNGKREYVVPMVDAPAIDEYLLTT